MSVDVPPRMAEDGDSPPPAEQNQVSRNDRMLSRMAASTGVVGAFGAAAAAALRFEPSPLFVGFVIVLLAAAFTCAAIPVLRAFSATKNKDLYLPYAVALLTIGATGVVAGMATRHDTTPESCVSKAAFDSPREGELVTNSTRINGRATICKDYFLWDVTRSANGEYVSRSRSPIGVNSAGNWIDAQQAIFSTHPPLNVTYCVMVTDARMTVEWQNRFMTIPLGGTLDLTGLSIPDHCLAEVTVRTR